MTKGSKMSKIANLLISLTHRNGGATVSLETGEQAHHTDGFYVGGLVKEVILELPLVHTEVETAIRQIRTQTNGSGYIGTWTNEDRVHVDASEWYRDVDTALAVARERGEIAIWEIAGGTELVC